MKGFTLLEVLIALVILSVGLLGLAGLQTTGLRNNHSAYLRSQATLLAYDITDRIRANKANLNAYALALSASAPSGTSVAETDLNEWLTNVENRLPEGDAS
ncbi:MAG TPA: type IV pilus modification protein PilV, partial [Gammaproteobacteria bacterium]|nr:type IV pilus modification protein PilV [Gammaproteobacteria bacterium]